MNFGGLFLLAMGASACSIVAQILGDIIAGALGWPTTPRPIGWFGLFAARTVLVYVFAIGGLTIGK